MAIEVFIIKTGDQHMPMISAYKQLTLLPAFMLLALAAIAQNAKTSGDASPKLFYVTTAETRPGDAVLVRGEDLDKLTKIEVARLPDDNVDNATPGYLPQPQEDALPDPGGTSLKAAPPAGLQPVTVDRLQQNAQSVKFIIPAGWKEGVYSVRITGAAGQANTFYVNAPVVTWVISEEGLQVTPGSYLRIQGKNLLRKGFTGQAVLISANGKQVRARVANAFDDYSVSVNIPAGLAAGNYHLYYHNGTGGKTAWSAPLQVTVAAKANTGFDRQTFNVKNYGARGDGHSNETAAFQAALAAAAKNNGGTVYVPPGRYMLTGDITIPPFTMLKGESQALTQLFWNPQSWDKGRMPNSLINGSHHFAIKDLNLWASRAWGIILLTGPIEEQGNITLENLIVRQTAQIGGQVYKLKASRDTVEAELNSRWAKTGIILRGPNLKVRNCDFNSSGMYGFSRASGFIQHCRFSRNNTGINQPYMVIHPKGLIFEDCYKQADGYSYGATIDESHNLYEARNTIPFDYTNDREVMTLDGGGGAYAGHIGNVNGTTLTLPAGADTYQWTPNKWNGGGVFIIDGRGAGQFRRIVSHTTNAITLDQPFLVPPDATSIISITTIRKNLVFVNNEVSDGGAYQLYGSAQNCVIAGLKMRRCNGIIGRGSLLYHGKQPNWYNDFVDCELREGNYCHWYGAGDMHSGYQSINLIGSGNAGLNVGALVRRNRLFDFSYIRTSVGTDPNSVTDVIIEDNSITNAIKAISLGGVNANTSAVLIHNNHYSNVQQQVDANQGLKQSSYMIMHDGALPATKP
ncbi:MAG TPA: glycosyl hydrolase family 28-related protein [Chitinophaga sp.]|uniref:glycosyl hydrolase family 28-related protein n=1 Tax=Chitinophaga sp. TaxID=1869181 RepID=UPI002DBEFC2D|nr:glycosyl hydrolase family 28-related protein [Chitinophaga sp.]HEU4554991.1 glycosyl hydrolase family 28-related protein [Chitinophaga sp.]